MSHKRTALLIIDVQAGFYNAECAPALEEIKRLLAEAPYDLYLATIFENHPESAFVKWMNWSQCMPGSDACNLLVEDSRIKVFKKNTYGSLDQPVLEALQDANIDRVYLCGFDTNMCVFATATQFFDDGRIEPFVLSKACSSHSGQEYHEAGLKLMAKAIGQDHIL